METIINEKQVIPQAESCSQQALDRGLHHISPLIFKCRIFIFLHHYIGAFVHFSTVLVEVSFFHIQI